MADNVARFLRLTRCGPSEILPGLFVGSLTDAKDRATLNRHRITSIVSVMEHVDHIAVEHRSHLVVALADAADTDLLTHIGRVNEHIHSERSRGGVVLVHCLAGVSRSVSFVLAYVMTVTALDYWPCMDAITHVRPTANPNCSFRMQLRRFESKHIRDERRQLRARHAADTHPSQTDDTRALLAHVRRAIDYDNVPECVMSTISNQQIMNTLSSTT